MALVQAFISCRLDYCNSLLAGVADAYLRRLQSVQNAAARLVSAGLIITTTSRRSLLACTGFQCASESPTRRRCLCGSAFTMQSLDIWLTCVCAGPLCAWSPATMFHGVWDCWSRVPRLLPVSAASPSMDHEHGTVCQPILEHQIRPSAPSSVISRTTCFSSSLRCCWQVSSAPFVRRRCDCLARVRRRLHSDLLTYFDLLTLKLLSESRATCATYLCANFSLPRAGPLSSQVRPDVRDVQ